MLTVLVGIACAAFAVEEVRIVAPGEVQYKSDPSVPGVGVALMSGNPKEGFYTIRAKLAPDTKVPAHFHPDARTVTVIMGVYYFAVGDRFDEGRLRGYGPGTVLVVPGGKPHFSAAKEGEVIVQEAGVGPTGFTPTGR
jgi:quercetin dioxygenase-like cupin family protein